MKSIGKLTKVAAKSVIVYLHDSPIPSKYNLVTDLYVLKFEIEYDVYFIGYSSNNFILIYQDPNENVKSWLSTGNLDNAFMSKFVKLLG